MGASCAGAGGGPVAARRCDRSTGHLHGRGSGRPAGCRRARLQPPGVVRVVGRSPPAPGERGGLRCDRHCRGGEPPATRPTAPAWSGWWWQRWPARSSPPGSAHPAPASDPARAVPRTPAPGRRAGSHSGHRPVGRRGAVDPASQAGDRLADLALLALGAAVALGVYVLVLRSVTRRIGGGRLTAQSSQSVTW